MKVAVVGATGMVGRAMIDTLQKRGLPFGEILAVASQRSAGQYLEVNGSSYLVHTIDEALEQRPALALFSAGSSTSLAEAPRFAEAGSKVIDNSSAWRLSPEHQLIVPEVNGSALRAADRIIANPNCSTIQLVMVLAPIHRRYGIARAVVSTYQAVTGTGMAAVAQLEAERRGQEVQRVYPYPIDLNVIPHCDLFEESGYTKEELKLSRETAKILDPAIRVTATAVRVPVLGGHSESVNLSLQRAYDIAELRSLLAETKGLIVEDSTTDNKYPMPVYARDREEVFVGRIRRDDSFANSLNLWIVADNLRKGAATNAVQIGELLLEKGWL